MEPGDWSGSAAGAMTEQEFVPSCLHLSGSLHINRKKVSKGLGLNRGACVNTIKLVSASSFSLWGQLSCFCPLLRVIAKAPQGLLTKTIACDMTNLI